jgi:signal transduction histidine kinase
VSFASALRDCVVTGWLLFDPQLQSASCTEEARQMLGLPPGTGPRVNGELVPLPLRELAREVASVGRPIENRQVCVVVRPRRTLTLRADGLPVRVAGHSPHVLLVISDFTPALRFENHVRHLDRLANLGTLSAGIAHEIKNALVAGKTLVDLLLEKNQEIELAELVRRELARIEAMVSGMLNFSVPDTTARCPVHLHEVLDRSLRLLQPRRRGRTLAIERSFNAARDLVRGNENQLQQAFLNLLLNSVEAMNQQGKLLLATELVSPDPGTRDSTKPPPAGLRIRIQDNGPGIAPDDLARVFEPFFSTKPSGTGLGLAISRQIIQEHGGSIQVDSQPGLGASFQILLPAAVEGI